MSYLACQAVSLIVIFSVLDITRYVDQKAIVPTTLHFEQLFCILYCILSLNFNLLSYPREWIMKTSDYKLSFCAIILCYYAFVEIFLVIAEDTHVLSRKDPTFVAGHE